MVFWRKSKKTARQEDEARDDKMLHPKGEPALEPPVEYDSDIDGHLKDRLKKSEGEILKETPIIPVPRHTPVEDAKEADELGDHSEEGGWLSRLTSGLSKSANRLARDLTDVLTKSKLDQKALTRLEDLLIEADLGPKTASSIIQRFSDDRFGDDVTENDIKTALAGLMENILKPVAKPLQINKPDDGPFVILVCGVNGAGKTTTIGKLSHQLKFDQKRSVMIAAADTFRAAAVEQLAVWAKRAHAEFFAKDVGADSAALAYEAYEKAAAQDIDVLMIDTAGRLQNKKNLMAELGKIVRVLQKKNPDVPHAVLLVLDSTTGQNAFSQVQAFKDMVDVTGLIVTKLDGSARGGVLIGLADQFGLPVHAIGVGEAIEDLQPFTAKAYAQALVGLTTDKTE